MKETHTSYKLSKALKEFLGESAPEPIKGELGQIWVYDPECPEDGILQGVSMSAGDYPAYALHDLLSKPFAEAFVKVGKVKFGFDEDEVTDFIADWSTEIAYVYWNGGLPAIEAELFKMMEGK